MCLHENPVSNLFVGTDLSPCLEKYYFARYNRLLSIRAAGLIGVEDLRMFAEREACNVGRSINRYEKQSNIL